MTEKIYSTTKTKKALWAYTDRSSKAIGMLITLPDSDAMVDVKAVVKMHNPSLAYDVLAVRLQSPMTPVNNRLGKRIHQLVKGKLKLVDTHTVKAGEDVWMSEFYAHVNPYNSNDAVDYFIQTIQQSAVNVSGQIWELQGDNDDCKKKTK